ncbi:MAG: hypothetical protein OEY52_00240 [Gammaproteobacteria bacterium]|nr:hypothetical protein [Gammaproteobacteria bacterium]
MRSSFFTLVILCNLISNYVLAEEQSVQQPSLILELPLADYPFNGIDGYTAPSMQQSLNITKNFYQYGHYKFDEWYADDPTGRMLSIVAFDVITTWLPFGDAWLHEEWHRAVMSHRNVDSYNEVYDLPLFADTISVKDVRDEDLVRLKADHPADMVRMHAAGLEAQNELNFSLEKDQFFNKTQTFDQVLIWLNYLNNIGYLHTCASNESNRITDELMEEEGQDISERDFTGLDCNAWVYDLFRPDEPYAARGVHPSGVGIRRYIKYADLTTEEQDYLETNARLSFLNLVNPFLLNQRSFLGTNPFNDKPMQWNASLRHHLTSFGYSIEANLFLKQDTTNIMLIWRNYFNKDHHFPGLELALYRLPVNFFGARLPVTVRAAIWQQPKDQLFTTSESEQGGLAGIKLHIPWTRQMESYFEVETKSHGWVAGNVYLEPETSYRFGIAAHLF